MQESGSPHQNKKEDKTVKKTTALILAFLAVTPEIIFGGDLDIHLSLPPIHTYSIVCYDSATGQIGAAVQSHYFRVCDVIHAEPGVGAVASQAFSDNRYWATGIELMRSGKTAQETLDSLLTGDENREYRQVGMIDAHGVSAGRTGTNCLAEGGSHVGHHFAAQASLMLKNTVWDAMAAAFENTQGDLAERMMVALEAAQAEGGDMRGMQSAAMIVVEGTPSAQPGGGRLVDLRVDDSPEPLKELRRLLTITRAYQKMNEGHRLLGAEKFDEAGEVYLAAAKLDPDNVELKFWPAVNFASVGQTDRALTLFKEVFAKEPHWRDVVLRLPRPDMLPDDPTLIEKILAQ
jgi:uncharacterized Ntn-hydrolase superfamily protein